MATFDERFAEVGSRLLQPGYVHDARFTEPVQDFWHLHLQLDPIRQDAEQQTTALAELDAIEWHIDRAQYEIRHGHVSPAEDSSGWLSPATILRTQDQRTPLHRHQSTVLPDVAAYRWSPVESDLPIPHIMIQTDNPRGPPTGAIAGFSRQSST